MYSNMIKMSADCDFKDFVDRLDPFSWLKNICAFANGIGGTLFFGLAQDGRVIGLNDAPFDDNLIQTQIRAHITPRPEYVITIISSGKVKIITLVVLAGGEAPYFCSANGVKRAYVRIGHESVPAPDQILNEIRLKAGQGTFDSTVTHLKKKDFSFTLLEATYFQRTGARFNKTDYAYFGLVSQGDLLTNAGTLLSDQAILGNSRLRCVRLDSHAGVGRFDVVLDYKDYEGGLIYLLSSGRDFIKNNTKVPFKKDGQGGLFEPDYSMGAVDEALVNALIHRDYQDLGGEIKIDVYRDQLTISSPGAPVSCDEVQGQDIEKVISVRRNPVIANLFQRLKFMDCRGGGLKKIVEETKKLPGYADDFLPTFHSTEKSFMVKLKNVNYNGEDTTAPGQSKENIPSDTEVDVMRLMRLNPKITQVEIAKAIGKSRRSVQLLTASLKKKGFVDREGSKHHGSWVLTEK